MEDGRHIDVMFTDIVGYTAFMGSDEDKARYGILIGDF
jgi:class 3 adenylate cyclase